MTAPIIKIYKLLEEDAHGNLDPIILGKEWTSVARYINDVFHIHFPSSLEEAMMIMEQSLSLNTILGFDKKVKVVDITENFNASITSRQSSIPRGYDCYGLSINLKDEKKDSAETIYSNIAIIFTQLVSDIPIPNTKFFAPVRIYAYANETSYPGKELFMVYDTDVYNFWYYYDKPCFSLDEYQGDCRIQDKQTKGE